MWGIGRGLVLHVAPFIHKVSEGTCTFHPSTNFLQIWSGTRKAALVLTRPGVHVGLLWARVRESGVGLGRTLGIFDWHGWNWYEWDRCIDNFWDTVRGHLGRGINQVQNPGIKSNSKMVIFNNHPAPTYYMDENIYPNVASAVRA